MTGILYIVPTPIGNLGDISERVKSTLADVDFVACEDTRVGGKLLFLLDIKKELVKHHDHNKKQSAAYITDRLLKGESCALISDAGTPAISDPGEVLVNLVPLFVLCRHQGFQADVLYLKAFCPTRERSARSAFQPLPQKSVQL